MTVVELVERERARVRARVLGAGVGVAVAAVAAVAALGAWVLAGARWLTLPRAVPALVWVAVLCAVAGVALWTRARLARQATRARVAAAIERERALRSGQLRGAIEIAESGGALGRLAAGQLATELAAHGPAPLAPALHRSVGRLALAGAAVAGLGVTVVAATAGSTRDGFAAVLHPADAWRGTLLPPIRFDRVPAAVVRGEQLRLQLRAPGRRAVTVAHRQTGRAWRTAVVPVDSLGRATVDLGAIDADLALAATDGRSTSDTARVPVTDRAFVGDVAVRAEYPAYLGRAAEPLPAGETLRVPRGTVLTVSGRASTALRDVALASGVQRVPLSATGHQFAGRLVAEASGRWSWSAHGAGGPIAELPTPLELDVVADSAPRVEITRPTADSVVDGLAPVGISVAASDDHGLAGVALRMWRERADGRRDPVEEATLATGVPLWAGEPTVDMAQRKLAPGERLHVQAVAVDGSPWRQGAVSRVVVLRVPSVSELRDRARDAADSAVARAVAAAAAQRDLQQRTSEAARSRESGRSASASSEGGASAGEKGSMSYDASERAKSLAQQQRQLAQQIQSLQEQSKALERQLSQAGALDASLAQQMQDVQKLLRDALTEEMAEQLRALEQSASDLSGAEARQAMEQLAAQQRALREQLERSVEMLKRAALEGAMQTLRDEARELAQAQRREADRMQQEPQARQQGERQGQQDAQAGERSDAQRSRELTDRSRDLARELESLEKRLKNERAEFGAQKVSEAGEHAEKSADAMQRAAQREQAAGRQPPPQRAQGAQQQGAQQQGAQQQGAQQQGAQQQGAQQQGAQQQGAQQQQGAPQQGGADAARRAAEEMQRAADQLASARQGQIEQWKSELSGELDQAIQETMQMAREQASLEQKARAGQDAASLRGEQNAVQQGVDQTAQRLDQAGKKSSLLSQRAQRAMGEAKQQVAQASQSLQQPSGAQGADAQAGQRQGAQGGAAEAMREAGEALNRAAAALVRDRERVNGAQSASGFSEMLEQLKQLAQQQGQINQAAAGLPIPMPGSAGQGARDASRQLARQQRGVADRLEDIGDGDPSGRSDALAREARQLAQALERSGADAATINRQQQLYRRLLDAGRTLQHDDRDESGKRESRSGAGIAGTAPTDGPQSGRGASKFEIPAWADLRGLSAEERRLVIEYFRRLNAERP
jgi:hypothetical protein